MKYFLHLTFATLCAVLVALQPALLWLVISALVLYAACFLRPMAQCNDATLILPILTGKVIKAFKTKVPQLFYFSTDFGATESGFAAPVKFGQEVISQLVQVPTVSDHVPGDDLSLGAQNIKDLLSDVRVKIDRAKKAVLKLPTADAVRLELDGAFTELVEAAGAALAKAVVIEAMKSITPDNFTQSFIETTANADFDTLGTARLKLNNVGADVPRYGVGGGQYVQNISQDPRVASGDYYGERTGGEPYKKLNDIEGFSEVSEVVNFFDGNPDVGTFTGAAATDLLTFATAHGLQVGDRVRVRNTGGALPAGLAASTNYFVQSVPSTTTIKLSATSGGAAIDLTADSTGTSTLSFFSALNAFFFHKRAIHVAIRQLIDNLDLAEKLGIPVPIKHYNETDPDTGVTFHTFMWIDVKTHDIYVAFAVAFGIKAGRGLAADSNTDPATLPAGSGMDYAGVRVTES